MRSTSSALDTALVRASFSQMAAGPNGRGVSVAVVGYDLCPAVSIADIIEQIRAACLMLWHRRRQRMLVYGHSAGGHLAACLMARPLLLATPYTLDPASFYFVNGPVALLVVGGLVVLAWRAVREPPGPAASAPSR